MEMAPGKGPLAGLDVRILRRAVDLIPRVDPVPESLVVSTLVLDFGISYSSAYRYVRRLVEAGIVDRVEKGREHHLILPSHRHSDTVVEGFLRTLSKLARGEPLGAHERRHKILLIGEHLVTWSPEFAAACERVSGALLLLPEGRDLRRRVYKLQDAVYRIVRSFVAGRGMWYAGNPQEIARSLARSIAEGCGEELESLYVLRVNGDGTASLGDLVLRYRDEGDLVDLEALRILITRIPKIPRIKKRVDKICGGARRLEGALEEAYRILRDLERSLALREKRLGGVCSSCRPASARLLAPYARARRCMRILSHWVYRGSAGLIRLRPPDTEVEI